MSKKIAVVQLGSARWPRFALADGHDNFWTGSDWTSEVRKALLYYDTRSVADDYEALNEAEHRDKPSRSFRATVHVRVRSDLPFDVQALKEYLSSAASLHLDHERFGPGPVPGFTHVEINWNSVEEVPPPKQSGEP